jgi:hypothetical protein
VTHKSGSPSLLGEGALTAGKRKPSPDEREEVW